MAECTNKNLGKMLSLYELNLLPEKDRLQFELHLYDCPACMAEVEGFSEQARIINHDPEIREIVDAEVQVHLDSEQKKISKQSLLGKFKISLMPSVIIAAAVILILILKPWHFEFLPTKEAIAQENRLAIMYFENITNDADPEKLGEIITSLLITDLAESEYMQVVSSQRLYDLLKMLGHEGLKRVNKEIASQVAQKASAEYMLLGNIINHENSVILQAQLILTSTGDIIASQRIVGSQESSLFVLVDSLSAAIKRDLSLPQAAFAEPDKAVADLTTNSTRAYRMYLEAVDDYFKFYKEEALYKFEEVVRIDSTFARAYYFLAGLKDKDLIYKALELNENGSRIDRYYFEIFQAAIEQDFEREESLLLELIEQYPDEKEAHFQLGRIKYYDREYEEAIKCYTDAIRIDPHYKGAFNQMIYTYDAMSNLEKALWAIDKYIEIAPDEANPYDSRGDLYVSNGMLQNGIESYLKALQIKPDFYASLLKLGRAYLYSKNYKGADSCFDAIVSAPKNGYTDLAYYSRVHTPFVQGRLNETFERIEWSLESGATAWPSYHFIKSQIFSELNNWPAALASLDSAALLIYKKSHSDSLYYEHFHIQTLANAGKIEEALKRAGYLRKYLHNQNENLITYYYAIGTAEMSRENYTLAASYFDSITTDEHCYHVRYMKGRAYLMAGRINSAINILESADGINNADRLFYGIWSVDIHFYLGQAYEKSGQIEKAIKEYEEFLTIWNHAADSLTKQETARDLLARLKNQL